MLSVTSSWAAASSCVVCSLHLCPWPRGFSGATVPLPPTHPVPCLVCPKGGVTPIVLPKPPRRRATATLCYPRCFLLIPTYGLCPQTPGPRPSVPLHARRFVEAAGLCVERVWGCSRLEKRPSCAQGLRLHLPPRDGCLSNQEMSAWEGVTELRLLSETPGAPGATPLLKGATPSLHGSGKDLCSPAGGPGPCPHR